MIFSNKSIASTEAFQNSLAYSIPYFLYILKISCFKPGVAIPPLRELAPQPIFFSSKTATELSDFASTLAAVKPVYPLPIITKSTLSGSSFDTLYIFPNGYSSVQYT